MIVDMHSHILPGIDDGSASVEESLAMLREEKKQGITQIIATPHFYPQHDAPERFLARRSAAYEKLRSAMEQEPDLPQILLGGEVYYYPGMSNSDVLQKLCIEGTRCILVEMPMAAWTQRMYQELADIRSKQGLLPIVAHVDRYLGVLSTHGIPAKLEQLPVLVQANASFFNQSATRSRALRMLKKGQIHLLGSDCHNMDSRRPNLGDAVSVISRHLGEEALEMIGHTQNDILK